jgi:hypothetical protein
LKTNPKYKLEINGDLIKIPYDGGIRNQNGNREGEWIYYYDNGKIGSKGNYVNDKKEGEWIDYHKNGEIRLKGNYVNDIIITLTRVN